MGHTKRVAMAVHDATGTLKKHLSDIAVGGQECGMETLAPESSGRCSSTKEWRLESPATGLARIINV